jgi:hypothetical protein
MSQVKSTRDIWVYNALTETLQMKMGKSWQVRVFLQVQAKSMWGDNWLWLGYLWIGFHFFFFLKFTETGAGIGS